MLQGLEAKVEGEGVGAAGEAFRSPAGSHQAAPVRGEFRVLMIAGGTGGHIFPALAVAEELRARSERSQSNDGCRIEFLGTTRGLESRLIPARGFSLHTVAAAGLKGIGGMQKFRNLMVLPRTALETARILQEFRPDVVVGLGSYLAGPAMLEAAVKDVPTLLIEPNAVPGFTNRVLAPVIRRAAVGFEQAARFYGGKARLTGHAVRKAFAEVPPKSHTPPFTVLIVGGSQGAKAINECVANSLPLLERDRERLKFVHQTGERDYNVVKTAYQERRISADVRPFIDDMPAEFARADLIVSRAGATAVSEIAAAGKASLLIPFPHATDQHQLENARLLQRAGAARVIEQVNLTPDAWVREIWDMLNRPDRIAEMERHARTLARTDAAERIAELIEGLAATGH